MGIGVQAKQSASQKNDVFQDDLQIRSLGYIAGPNQVNLLQLPRIET
jgi:hypothetical protein